MKNNRRPGELTHIADVLSGIVKSVRRESHTELDRIRDTWNRVVDSVISDNTRPAALKNDILLVHVASSTLTHQLRFLTPAIIEQINRVMGEGRIAQIKYKIGRIDHRDTR